MRAIEDIIRYVVFPIPVIDLDEGKVHTNLDQYVPFTKVLKRYLKFRTENKDHPNPSLDKFRLRMGNSPVREDILEKLLTSFAVESSIKELDLSFLEPHLTLVHCGGLSFQALVNVKSLTSLSLDYVNLKDDVTRTSGGILAPSSKTISLKCMLLPSSEFLHELVSSCPSIENLLVTSCDVQFTTKSRAGLRVSSIWISEIAVFSDVYVSECEHLESVILGSECPTVRLDLTVCGNLKYINICTDSITEIVIDRCKDCLEATIDARYLLRFQFNGFNAMKCTNGRRSFCNIQ
ncbi:hypothetical protein M0R45_025522 [Rubus argutus]|uniref:F-box/LRR-repeat protein 15/At3g58940/PEG3-like LRR domain-containing protein n=1 Tax=Rubus argutus TaxID=59490 RepID=A0AAW1WU80_RUBAR